MTQGDSLRRVSELADVSDRTLSRQLRDQELRPDMVIKIAQAYNESPSEALVDLGFMDEKWLTSASVRRALMKATDEQLTDELLRRLNLLPDAPVDDVARERNLKAVSDVSDMNDGTVRPFDYSEYAADSSEDETEARMERGEDLID